MFSNFLYILIALVIYSSADLFGPVNPAGSSMAVNSLLSNILFVLVCHAVFKRLKKKALASRSFLDEQLINSMISRLSAFALLLFALNLYLFKIHLLFNGMFLFKILPTAEAVIFLGLFLFYLIVIWDAAYRVHNPYFKSRISGKEFIFSNVSFALPALLPWFILSLSADCLNLIPWAPVKRLMNTTAGEIGFIFLFVTAVAVLGPVLIHKLWRCRPLEDGIYRTRIENVCTRAGLKYRNVLKWDLFGGTMITAGVMGIVARFRYILVTPALLHSLEDDEIDAVIMHEIGHIQKYHMLFYLFFFAGFIACNFVFFEPVMLLLYIATPFYSAAEFLGITKDTVHPLLICITLIGFFVLYFRYIFGFFMRNFERQADLHVYNFIDDASPLISTFYKIAAYSGQPSDKPNWHHYSIGERIDFLKTCQSNPLLINRHHLFIKKMIAGYFMIILMLFSAGYTINYGPLKTWFSNFIAESILLQQLDLEPQNSNLYALVGDYHYNRENFQQAIDSYENVLMIDPENVHALNNLAWLFATCRIEEFKDRKKALEYAVRALRLEIQPYILDTYAEACFINDNTAEAIRAAKQALDISTEKKEYYRDQLQKFKDAAKG